jgi:xylan 1,4-beta-xylosidase
MAVGVLLLLSAAPRRASTAPQSGDDGTIAIDPQAHTTPLPHFWEQMFGSGRAVLALRADYQRDLRKVERATGFRYVRFHGIFDDEVGLYHEAANGTPVYNFSYVDQIYDALLSHHVRPFVELSFMPPALSASPVVHHVFWYKPVVSPPKSWDAWDALIDRFARHLIDRYGIGEVSTWYFEVWNEPNLDFWAGVPKQSTYFELYDHTARTLKEVSPLLRVGGPATAQAAWIPAFLDHVTQQHVPVDFVSTHIYGQDPAKGVFGTDEAVPITQMVCRAAGKVHTEVKASPLPNLPVFFTEYNATFRNDPAITDSLFMGPWLADTIRQCDGLTDLMSFWTFSDVFEEQGIVQQPFYGGFGLIAADGLPKPSFNAFALLHDLGTERVTVSSDSAIVTKRPDGKLVIATWNLALPGEPGTPKTVSIDIKGLTGRHVALISRVDATHGSLLAAYAAMGHPVDPTRDQIEALRRAAVLPPPEVKSFQDGRLTIVLPPDGLALIQMR